MNDVLNSRWTPFVIGVPFTATITGVFTLSDSMPMAASILAAAVWGAVLGFAAMWLQAKPRAAAWVEDLLVASAIFVLAFLACGGVMALRTLNGALTSSSLTGETLEAMFWPMIPYYITANAPMELFIVPALLFLGWRPGPRRILIATTAVLFFVFRVWTYIAYAPGRLGFTQDEHSSAALSAADRQTAYLDLKLDDPRWILLLVIMGVLVAAAALPRLREAYPASSVWGLPAAA